MTDAIPLSRRVPVSAVAALLRVTAERQVRGARAPAFGLLHAVPVLIAALSRTYSGSFEADQLEELLVFGLIPQALIPLTALLFAAGMVNDDIDERTITYLLVRPIPKWLIYLVKAASTVLVTSMLASASTLATLAAIHWGEPGVVETVLKTRGPVVCATSVLSLAAYVPIFGLLSLLVHRSLIIGVVYTVVLEGLLANVDFVARRGTVMYWVRVLWVRRLEIAGGPWSIDPAAAPSATTALTALLGAGILAAAIGAWIFSEREFRVKTSDAG
jgi:ABC-2 type transport system permease protein